MNKAEAISMLFAGYPSSKLENPTLFVYLEVLADVSAAELEAVVRQVLSKPGAFPPSPGDLLDEWRLLSGQLPRKDAAVRGWMQVMEALSSFPAKALSDPITIETVRAMGGMSALRRSESPSMDRRDFIRMYEAISTQKAEDARVRPESARITGDRPKLLERRDND